MPVTQAYIDGVENGKLCRKYSNQHTDEPSNREWAEDFQDGNYSGDEAEFVLGCKDGWAKASGNSKVKEG